MCGIISWLEAVTDADAHLVLRFQKRVWLGLFSTCDLLKNRESIVYEPFLLVCYCLT